MSLEHQFGICLYRYVSCCRSVTVSCCHAVMLSCSSKWWRRPFLVFLCSTPSVVVVSSSLSLFCLRILCRTSASLFLYFCGNTNTIYLFMSLLRYARTWICGSHILSFSAISAHTTSNIPVLRPTNACFVLRASCFIYIFYFLWGFSTSWILWLSAPFACTWCACRIYRYVVFARELGYVRIQRCTPTPQYPNPTLCCTATYWQRWPGDSHTLPRKHDVIADTSVSKQLQSDFHGS